MCLPFSIEQVIEITLDATAKKIREGKLIPMSQDYDFYADDEAQTVYSIFNLHRDLTTPEYEDQILEAMYKKYQSYFS